MNSFQQLSFGAGLGYGSSFLLETRPCRFFFFDKGLSVFPCAELRAAHVQGQSSWIISSFIAVDFYPPVDDLCEVTTQLLQPHTVADLGAGSRPLLWACSVYLEFFI
jgi:hypothetical protein